MRFTEERISHLSHLIHDGLYMDDLADYRDEDEALNTIKKAFAEFIAIDEECDTIASQKVASLKRGVAQGGNEWLILHRKYYEEEMRKKGF